MKVGQWVGSALELAPESVTESECPVECEARYRKEFRLDRLRLSLECEERNFRSLPLPSFEFSCKESGGCKRLSPPFPLPLSKTGRLSLCSSRGFDSWAGTVADT